jgi:hypothetical protein
MAVVVPDQVRVDIDQIPEVCQEEACLSLLGRVQEGQARGKEDMILEQGELRLDVHLQRA